jgi:archaellum component FlaF (FlaF/FlaG flagellin family)
MLPAVSAAVLIAARLTSNSKAYRTLLENYSRTAHAEEAAVAACSSSMQ